MSISTNMTLHMSYSGENPEHADYTITNKKCTCNQLAVISQDITESKNISIGKTTCLFHNNNFREGLIIAFELNKLLTGKYI